MWKIIVVSVVVLALVGAFAWRQSNMPGLSPVAVEFGGKAGQDAVIYGYIPNVSNLTLRSYSAWVYSFGTGTGTYDQMIMSAISDSGGFYIAHHNGLEGVLYLQSGAALGSGDYGAWRTPNNSAGLNTRVHVVVTRDVSSPSNDPIIYINGVAQTLTEIWTPTNPVGLEDGAALIVGNYKTSAFDYSLAYYGEIFDPRVYNRILTAAEVTAIYNGGTPSMSAGTKTGLVFQPFAVRTEKLADYIDQPLTGLKLFDAQFLAVGSVHGAPIGRAAP